MLDLYEVIIIQSFGVNQMQYADDTTQIQTDCFHALHHWLDLNGLSLNPDKTEAIVIGTSARQVEESHVTSVDLGDVTVLTSDSVKSLGVALDDTLSFQKHINAMRYQPYNIPYNNRPIYQFVSDADLRRTSSQSLLTRLSMASLCWAHAARLDDSADIKKILTAFPPEDWKRPSGCLQIKWI